MVVLALHPDLVMESVVVIAPFSWPLLCHLKALGAMNLVFHNPVRLRVVIFDADRKGSSLSSNRKSLVADLQFERTFIKSSEGKIFSPSAHITFEFCIHETDVVAATVVAYG